MRVNFFSDYGITKSVQLQAYCNGGSILEGITNRFHWFFCATNSVDYQVVPSLY